MSDPKFGLNNPQGRFRPSFAFSSNWSSSGSEGHGRGGSFFGRNTSMQMQKTLNTNSLQNNASPSHLNTSGNNIYSGIGTND